MHNTGMVELNGKPAISFFVGSPYNALHFVVP
jgi:hypothetical protein